MNSSSKILPKGSSCSTCKARKVKCDAIKPACTACKRSARHRHEDPELVRCCYSSKRREKGARGIGGLSSKSSRVDENVPGAAKVDYEESEKPIELKLPNSSQISFESLNEALELPCPPTLDGTSYPNLPFFDHPPFALPDAGLLANDLYTFPLLPLDGSSAPSSNLFQTSYTPYTFLENSSPSPNTLGTRNDASRKTLVASPTLISSSISTLSSTSSFSSFASIDSNPFSLADELSLYDSSVPTSPHSATSSLDEDLCNSYYSSPTENFESLTLPLFPSQW
ncbi:hypothetical protein JCM3765_007294 [Sporobolomyces pararoseus]